MFPGGGGAHTSVSSYPSMHPPTPHSDMSTSSWPLAHKSKEPNDMHHHITTSLQKCMEGGDHTPSTPPLNAPTPCKNAWQGGGPHTIASTSSQPLAHDPKDTHHQIAEGPPRCLEGGRTRCLAQGRRPVREEAACCCVPGTCE